ncbi:MAG TPA: SAM-dependent methyltransferase [Dehalococcoidia bacterium]|nr:SAM-dependent methyltransferase [Dehalococcoidia bacterium]
MSSEFEPSTENEALKEAIVARIRQEGPIPFREFMAMALYAPGLGYYCSPRAKMGREGDYLTSPEVSPIFGALVGRQLREMWEAMGQPEPFDVVEAGAGTGALCRDVLRWAGRTAPRFFEAIRYTLVEMSPALAARQRSALEADGAPADRVRWDQALPPEVKGCMLSNELLDALPVHRVEVRDGRLLEVFVAWEGDRFVEELREPSTPDIEAYFERLGLLPGEECRAEVNLEALRWMGEAGRSLAQGFVLTLDYGHEARELFAPWRRDGTLLCFYRHNASGDPYARLGRQDMTSHVDFTSLRRAGEEAGLTTLGTTSQSQFLANLGIVEAAPPLGEGDVNLEEYYARRRAVIELVDPAGLGRIRVLAQAKGMAGCRLTGLEGRTE